MARSTPGPSPHPRRPTQSSTRGAEQDDFVTSAPHRGRGGGQVRAKDALGRYGENVAAAHLSDAGLEILARNWRCEEGEIDIVARERGAIVICEVKTRSSVRFGAPAEAVSRRKADRLRRLAYLWLQDHPAFGADIRFDVVSVLRSERGAAVVEHVRAAF